MQKDREDDLGALKNLIDYASIEAEKQQLKLTRYLLRLAAASIESDVDELSIKKERSKPLPAAVLRYLTDEKLQ